MQISGMDGNGIYCMAQKGLSPGETVVGNSVVSMGLAGSLSAAVRTVTGGEVTQTTEMISEGRHAAIGRMEAEARHSGAIGVTGVESRLGYLAGYPEFLSQGTGVHATSSPSPFFSTAASGIGLYCQLDAGYHPVRFAMGNVAYALGMSRGVMGQLRTMARGEVKEFSSMYNEIRRTALHRLKTEAAAAGANAVVDTRTEMLPYGPGTVELLMTGTASRHPGLSHGPVGADQVVTSELTGEELWNLARLGFIPHQIVMATSVYSLGIAAGVGTFFRSAQRGELPELTKLIYEARENCVDLVRQEAQRIGAERVMSTRLDIREIGQGLVEIVAIGTAVRRPTVPMPPYSDQLIPQALVLDRSSLARTATSAPSPLPVAPTSRGFTMSVGGLGRGLSSLTSLVIGAIMLLIMASFWILQIVAGASQ